MTSLTANTRTALLTFFPCVRACNREQVRSRAGGIKSQRRRLAVILAAILIAARSVGLSEALVGDMRVHSVVPVQGIRGALTVFEASVEPLTHIRSRTPV